MREESAREDLHSEHGVSYLIQTDQQTILMDLGNNIQNTDPAPLEENMARLGISMQDVDVLVISHNHPDHLGGVKWWQKSTFSAGSEQADLAGIDMYLPAALTYPGSQPVIAEQPQKIAEGVATLGRQPFVQPYPFLLRQPLEWEQSLVVNVEGQGLVVITGCGHPTIEKITARAGSLFDLPVAGVVGGLHYEGLSEKDIRAHIDFLRPFSPRLVALSPHDNGELAISLFQQAFPGAYQYLRVGEAIHLP